MKMEKHLMGQSHILSVFMMKNGKGKEQPIPDVIFVRNWFQGNGGIITVVFI
jgi:hypothetical protein